MKKEERKQINPYKEERNKEERNKEERKQRTHTKRKVS